MTDDRSWQGKLNLIYERVGDKTRVRSQMQAPLKVQRPFYPEGENVCHSIILHTAGGIVGGDRLSQEIQLHPQANATITTAAAAKVYRSNGQVASQEIAIEIAPGACLEWLPQETILFNGAEFQQNLRVELAPGSHWCGWEIIRCGRTARGEKFLRGNWRSQTEIWQQGTPLWIDRQQLKASETIWNSPHGLAGCPVLGSLVYLGNPVSEAMRSRIWQLWEAPSRRGEAGVTSTLAAGVLCRYRGHSVSEVKQWLTQTRNELRSHILGRPPLSWRIWR